MEIPNKDDLASVPGKADLEMDEAGRCQYCSAQCGGTNKCGSAPLKDVD